ncbi:Oxidase ustYa [Pseudocercospora fuligena]|uniref:Oxidase ustYa n=1 Tax=Pseudocercospora fuligena TaxID=685502 RepID=A0A8H6RU92_9PEZI|nr:Oxidase ustYa [Pseudocercospora fuligena]
MSIRKANSEDVSCCDSTDPLLDGEPSFSKSIRRTRSQYWLLAILFISCGANLMLASGLLEKIRPASSCGEPVSHFTESVDRSRHTFEFLPWPYNFTKYTLPTKQGGDSLEDAWIELGAYTLQMLIPPEYATDFGIDPDKHVLYTPETQENAPYTGYLATPDALHNLHCLNVVREALYYNYDYYRMVHLLALVQHPDDVQTHIGHCVDHLRQALMCYADTNVMPYKWSDEGTLLPVFGIQRQCRNFEAVKQWVKDHEVKSHLDIDDHHFNVD